MTEQEAKELCARFAAEHPDRATHRWIPMRSGEDWSVAKIGLAPTGDGSPETRVDERPPTSDDPRSAPWLNPPSGGIV